MTRQSQFLSILLVLQIALAVILYFTETDSGAFVSNEKMLDLKFDALDKIVIEETEKKTLVLLKQNKNWILPGYFDFQASKEKLDRVFGKIFETGVGWPVATTASAAKRFKVAPDSFERKLAFSTANTTETLYLGSSPGFKKIHARIDGENTIYGIEFSAYQASTKPIDWADQSILHVPGEEINAIEISGMRIKRDKDKFVIEGLAQGEEALDSEIQTLFGKVSSIDFQEVLGKKDDPSYQLDSAALELTLVKKDEQRIGYRYGKLKDKEDYVLKSSGSDYYFRIPKYDVDSLLGFDRKKLVKTVAAAPETMKNEPESGERTPKPVKESPKLVEQSPAPATKAQSK